MSKAAFNLFGDIVANDADRWFESDVTPAIFVGWLQKQTGDVEININSNGGDVAGGLAIANAIKAYTKGETVCNVLGVAASMASVVACAGKRLCMGEGSFLMIHNPWTVTMGDAEDLRKDAETLDKMRDSILSFYLAKCPGKTADDFKALMDAESWLDRTAAAGLGFAVENYEGEFRAAASLTRRAFDKAPEAARAFIDLKTERPSSSASAASPASPEGNAAPGQNWEARFKGLSAKFNDLQKRSVDLVAAAEAERDNFKAQLEQSVKDLADANAKVSELSAKLEEGAKALQAANEDLAATRDSLKKAEDKAADLEKTRDLLTAGVLTPASEASYEAQMKAAKTPEAREALRAKKREGKIK